MNVKGLILKVFACFFVMAYLLSQAGLDVHSCEDSGRTYVVFLSRSLSCEDIHSDCHHPSHHEHDCRELGHKCCAEGISSDVSCCCHDVTHLLLANAYSPQQDKIDFDFSHLTICACCWPSNFVPDTEMSVCCCGHDRHSGHCGCTQENLSHLNCILRV